MSMITLIGHDPVPSVRIDNRHMGCVTSRNTIYIVVKGPKAVSPALCMEVDTDTGTTKLKSIGNWRLTLDQQRWALREIIDRASLLMTR